MADIEKVVVVTVLKLGAVVSRAGFGTTLGVFQVPTSVQSGRFALYSSVSELTDAGLAATHPAVLWATVIKGQNPSPTQFAIGRRVEGTAQVDTVTITLADAGTWTVTINTVVFSYVATASDTVDTIAAGLKASIDAGDEALVTGTVSSGAFTVTAFVAGEPFTNGGITPPGSGMGTFVNTIANAAAEAMATALTAINAANTKDWYFLNIETRNDSDISAAQTFITALKKIFVGQSRDSDAKDGVTPNIFATIQALSDPRVNLVWHDDDSEFLDALYTSILSGFQLDVAGGVGSMFMKGGSGVPADELTSGEITNIAGDGDTSVGFGGNVYVELAGNNAFLYGMSTDGEFTDVQTTLDWTYFRTAEAIVALQAGTPTKIPYTNAGIGQVQNEVQGVMDRGVTNGHFSPDTPPTVTVPKVSAVSATDKSARTLRNVTARAELSGAIHKTFIRVEVGA